MRRPSRIAATSQSGFCSQTKGEICTSGVPMRMFAAPYKGRGSDATVAIAMALLAFLLPVGGAKRLLEWEEFKRIPWDVLILFGGGFALADYPAVNAWLERVRTQPRHVPMPG